jgi:hypothetical protein
MSNRRPKLQGRALWMNVEKVDGRPTRPEERPLLCARLAFWRFLSVLGERVSFDGSVFFMEPLHAALRYRE